jgi:hypothetical protein
VHRREGPCLQPDRGRLGNLYGTATEGGVQNPNCIDGSCGVVFELVRNFDADGQNAWTYKVLHAFCEQGGTNCADGSNTHSGLLMTRWGNLYGDAARGGAHTTDNLMGGTVFELAPSFNGDGQQKWTFKTLYSFCAQQLQRWRAARGARAADGRGGESLRSGAYRRRPVLELLLSAK